MIERRVNIILIKVPEGDKFRKVKRTEVIIKSNN